MRLLSAMIAVILGLALAMPLAHAHGDSPGHRHKPISEKQAVATAKKIVATMVREKAVEATWTGASLVSATKKAVEGGSEWVVIFSNPKSGDAAQRTLYVFLDPAGEYLAANYTGR